MIKKITVKQLKPGMYIHDFNCAWHNHPFLSNSLKVKNEQVIEKIISYDISNVYIDTEKGLDVRDAPTREEVTREIKDEINRLAEPEIQIKSTTTVKEEIVRARAIKKEAKQTVEKIMEDVRFGKQIEMEKVDHVVEKMMDSVFRNKDALTSLGRIKKTDEYTFVHSVSVCVLMISFGKKKEFDNDKIKKIAVGGLLHDIGKVKIPAALLNHKGQLSEEDFNTIKQHAAYSISILEETPDINEISMSVAAHHHEKLDGSGYPRNLKDDQISIYGKMTAIVDVYDAMTSKRVYQRQFQPTETLGKLYEWSTIYDRELVELFISCMGIYPVGCLVRLDNGLLGIVVEHDDKNSLNPTVRVVYDANQKRHIMPYDIDLAVHESLSITDYDVPEKWGIDPARHLM
jgi:HD-GYP domain-containing protein (c-di-GMP phosphodiesterase class II)